MGPAADVFFAPTDGSQAPIRLSETNENIYIVSWVPDSSGVIVAQDKGGNERQQLFRIDIAQPLCMHPLTDKNPNYYLRGGELHPNNKYLIYGANYDSATGEEIEPTWIYRHNIQTGARIVLAKTKKGGYITPSLSFDGNYVLYSRHDLHPAGQQMWLVDIEGRNDREILNTGADSKVSASWFPDENKLLTLSEVKTHRKLGVMDVSSDNVEWILDNPHRNIESAYIPYGCKDVVLIDVQNARTQASLLNLKTRKETPLSFSNGNLIPLAPSSPDEWTGLFYSSTQPDELLRFSIVNPGLGNASISRTWDQTSLIRQDFTQAEDYHWSSIDGMQIQGFLYRPAVQPKGTIIYMHGGPTYHSQDAINNQIQLFARSGYVVLDPNYRGSTGFGLEYQEAIKESGWGGREQEDIRAGIEKLILEKISQPGKIAMTGTSYGGYSAWWAITHFPEEIIAAAAPICGMTDLVVDYKSTRPDIRPYSEEMMGGSPDRIPQKYAERSPINYIGNIQGKLLIVQGKRDPNVTPENVRVVLEVLDKAAISYEVLQFEDEGHGISKPKNQKILYKALLDFFDSAFG
jgi:dipeptidyl aminopeptidase/acylaminoacyl peptidase